MADEKKESVLDMTTDVKKETKVESAEAKLNLRFASIFRLTQL